jgi:DNA-binding NarL/FixJ family response regulator
MAACSFQLEEDELAYSPQRTATGVVEQRRVLLIEDSEEAMLLVRFAIEEYGHGEYSLEWSHSLSDGLEQLATHEVDVILLDLGLPDSSGPESYAWVREIAPQVPVVVLTGDDRQETEYAVTASGAEGYLLKHQASGANLIEAIKAALYCNKTKRSNARERSLFPAPFRIG